MLHDFDGGTYQFANSSCYFFYGDWYYLPGNRRIRLHNATMTGNNLEICVSKSDQHTGYNRVELDNSTLTLSGKFQFPINTDGCSNPDVVETTELRLDNGSTFSFSGYQFEGRYNKGYLTNKTQVVTLDNGSTFRQTGSGTFDFATAASHYVFNILNGSTFDVANRQILFGYYGIGQTDVNLSNTTWTVGINLLFGPRKNGGDPSSTDYKTVRGTLNLYDATMTNTAHALQYTSGGFKLVDSLLVGEPFLMQAVDAAETAFHANGGTFRFMHNAPAATDLLHDWDTATIGARGLAVDNQCQDIAVSQDFADAPDETGVLTFTGDYDFTLSSTNTTVSTVAIAGTTATFADTAKFASTLVVTNGAVAANLPTNSLAGLVVGDAATTGTVALVASKTVDVDGEIAFAGADFTMSGAPTVDVEWIAFRAETASATSRDAWCNASFAGVPEHHHLDLSVREADGLVLFTLTLRENPTDAARVVSGTVTVGGVTYQAGEMIQTAYSLLTLTVEDATDAVIALEPRMTALAVTAGTVQLTGGTETELFRSSLTVSLGAEAVFKVPSNDLYLLGTLTAEDGAAVQGPGTLIGTYATCPSGISLTGGARYQYENGTFSWPSSGAAYVPNGVSVTLTAEDQAKAAAVTKIVFLDENGSMTYGGAEDWALATPLEGPGRFRFVSAGAITLSADNARLTGSFYFTNTTCLVTHENGLGGTNAGECVFWNGANTKELTYGHTLDFDNGAAVMTNHVSVTIYADPKDQSVRFGSASLEKTLVQEGDFVVGRAGYSSSDVWYRIYLNLANNVTFLAGFTNLSWEWRQYFGLNGTEGGDVRFLGSFRNVQSGIWFVGAGNYHFACTNVSFSTRLDLGSGATFTCGEANQFKDCSFYNDQAGTKRLVLNGYDQGCTELHTYGGSITAGDPVLNVESDTPASLSILGAGDYNINPDFSGAAGLTMAGSGTYRLYNSKNDTTGLLKVSSGTLEICDNSYWKGASIEIAGGCFAVRAAAATGALSRRAAMSVAASGATLELDEGRHETVRSLKIGDTFAPAGTYGGAEAFSAGLVDADHTLGFIAGKGLLTVRFSNDAKSGFMLILR